MLHFLLIQNRQGKTRIQKWYHPYNDEERRQIKTEIHKLVNSRDSKFTNFVEWNNYKIIYRRYAGLFFCVCCDPDDNELAIFEGIHLFVEILDVYFGNVCELDLVFYFNKVYTVLDEIFMAGEIVETSRNYVLKRIEQIDELETHSH